MTPYQKQLVPGQSYIPQPFVGAHQHQPLWQVSHTMTPVNFSGATQMLVLMPLVNPMIPAQAMNYAQYCELSLGHQEIESEGSDLFGKLQGCWETDMHEAKKIEVIIVGQGDQRRALVRNACSQELSFTHQIIYEQDSRFTLCTMDGHVEAVMLKGSIVKDFMKWYTNDGTWVIWRRIVFDGTLMSELTNVSSQLRFNSKSDSSEKEPSDKILDNHSVRKTQSSSFCESKIPQSSPFEDLLHLFQVHCEKNPILLEKVLNNGGISPTLNHPVTEKEVMKLSQGRLWVCARLTRFAKKDAGYWQRILDEIKGAYLEVTPGVYHQPYQPDEKEGWHRLRKSKRGRWMIEKYIEERGV